MASEFYVLLEGSLSISVGGKEVGEYHADAHHGLHPHFGEQARAISWSIVTMAS